MLSSVLCNESQRKWYAVSGQWQQAENIDDDDNNENKKEQGNESQPETKDDDDDGDDDNTTMATAVTATRSVNC